MFIMTNLIVPFNAVVDAETRKIIADLKVQLREALEQARSWEAQAKHLREDKERHIKDIAKLQALKEKLEPACRELMAFLDIDEHEGWF